MADIDTLVLEEKNTDYDYIYSKILILFNVNF